MITRRMIFHLGNIGIIKDLSDISQFLIVDIDAENTIYLFKCGLYSLKKLFFTKNIVIHMTKSKRKALDLPF